MGKVQCIMLNANALYRGVDSENEIRRFTRTFSNFHCSARVFHAVAGPDMAPSKAVKLPPCCGVRGCYGDVAYKSDFRLQCKTSLNHTGWLVELNGARQWEFTTRGRSSVKGIVVEPKSVEQHENPILQDETEKAKPANQLVKGSEGDVVSSVALVTASQPETAVVEDPTLNALSSAPPVVAERVTSEQGLGAPAASEKSDLDRKLADTISESAVPKTSISVAKASGKKRSKASSVPDAEPAAVDLETPEKKKARQAPSEESLSPPSGFGGKQIRAEGCLCCECPRQKDQRGRLCPSCMLFCKKVLGHQRIDELMGDKDAVIEVRSLTLEQRGSKKIDTGDNGISKDLMERLEKIFKKIPKLEKLVERLENLSVWRVILSVDFLFCSSVIVAASAWGCRVGCRRIHRVNGSKKAKGCIDGFMLFMFWRNGSRADQ